MSIVIGETLLALSNVSMNYVNGTEKQVKENAKFSDQLGTTEVNNIVNEIYDKLDIENPIIRINTAFKGCSSLEKISVLPRIYHN